MKKKALLGTTCPLMQRHSLSIAYFVKTNYLPAVLFAPNQTLHVLNNAVTLHF
jgi:hypothetical protein